MFVQLWSRRQQAVTDLQGRMLGSLGTAWALAAAPLVSAALMAAIAVFPNIVVIGIGEILRKV